MVTQEQRIEQVKTPAKMLFNDVTVVLDRGSFGREKPVEYVEAQFAWKGGTDKIRLTGDKASKDEMEAFYDELKPFNGQDCNVTFKVSARRGQWGNDYRLLEIEDIRPIDGGKTPKSSTSSGVV